MATVKDITTMCKSGSVPEAYQMAKADLEASTQNVWAQREVGWALYYMLKLDLQNRASADFVSHLEELSGLDLLTAEEDSLIFDNVLWKLAEFIRYIPKDCADCMDRLFSIIEKYTFKPSVGYSYLLKSCLGFVTWPRLVNFFEWWNVDRLLPDDYHQYTTEKGQKIMSLAEQVYIAYSKALLRLNDKDRIREFFPKIETLMEEHPEMMYPGYFCGKLMLATGAAKEDALNIVMPFVRKKSSEFWIWQLLSEIYKHDAETSLSCLLRAVHCRTQECFLGKVRIKIVSLYLSRNDCNRAKHHLDQVTRCYVQNGWKLPYEIQDWTKEPWVKSAVADSSDGVDYKKITDSILSYGANESLAVVTYVDVANKRAALIYGKEKRVMLKFADLHVRVKEGTLLKIYWTPAMQERMAVVRAETVDSVAPDCAYIKVINGSIEKPSNKSFAFIKGQNVNCFISPKVVQKYSINGGENVTALAVYDYNKKKEEWTWSCVSLKK